VVFDIRDVQGIHQGSYISIFRSLPSWKHKGEGVNYIYEGVEKGPPLLMAVKYTIGQRNVFLDIFCFLFLWKVGKF
jgi:hypothetical protein